MKDSRYTQSFITPSITSDISMTSTYRISTYAEVKLIDTIILKDTVELVYRGFLNLGTSGYDIWKDVYGCVDGKFGKIGTIIGEYVPAEAEGYRFH